MTNAVRPHVKKHHRPSHPRTGERGYTVVEVMSAMTLFAIGAAGVISMQRVTIQGGDDARKFDLATNIAHEWEHRLQRDAFNWTEPNSVVSTSNRATATLWLKAVADSPGTWAVPAGAPAPPIDGYSNAFDLLGKDIDPSDPDHIFCVQYRLSWLAKDQGTSDANPTALIRAEIRVFWSRTQYGPPDCSDLNIYETSGTRQKTHFVFVTTAIRGNPWQ
jgi:prepilin-type N-terminal cleavage/methylation domain-containing protein